MRSWVTREFRIGLEDFEQEVCGGIWPTGCTGVHADYIAAICTVPSCSTSHWMRMCWWCLRGVRNWSSHSRSETAVFAGSLSSHGGLLGARLTTRESKSEVCTTVRSDRHERTLSAF